MPAKLCVLIPVFNGQAGLVRTCASLAKAEGDFDVIVVDDGSSPPVRLETNAAGRHPITISRLDFNGGITRALNHGLRLAYEIGYEFIGRLDASDTVSPSRFVKQLAHLTGNADCGLVGSLIDFVDLTGERLFVFLAPGTHRQIVARMQVENCIIHSGVMMRTETIQQAGGYRETCLASEDYDLFRRILRISQGAILSEVLTRCEYNLRGLSIAKRGRQQRERMKLQLTYFEPANWMSYYGLARTCVAMCTPHGLVLMAKRLFRTFGGRSIENPVVG